MQGNQVFHLCVVRISFQVNFDLKVLSSLTGKSSLSLLEFQNQLYLGLSRQYPLRRPRRRHLIPT